MDYRELLKEYIRYVKECEGVTFLEWKESVDHELTTEQFDHLQLLAQEIEDEKSVSDDR